MGKVNDNRSMEHPGLLRTKYLNELFKIYASDKPSLLKLIRFNEQFYCIECDEGEETTFWVQAQTKNVGIISVQYRESAAELLQISLQANSFEPQLANALIWEAVLQSINRGKKKFKIKPNIIDEPLAFLLSTFSDFKLREKQVEVNIDLTASGKPMISTLVKGLDLAQTNLQDEEGEIVYQLLGSVHFNMEMYYIIKGTTDIRNSTLLIGNDRVSPVQMTLQNDMPDRLLVKWTNGLLLGSNSCHAILDIIALHAITNQLRQITIVSENDILPPPLVLIIVKYGFKFSSFRQSLEFRFEHI